MRLGVVIPDRFFSCFFSDSKKTGDMVKLEMK